MKIRHRRERLHVTNQCVVIALCVKVSLLAQVCVLTYRGSVQASSLRSPVIVSLEEVRSEMVEEFGLLVVLPTNCPFLLEESSCFCHMNQVVVVMGTRWLFSRNCTF